MQLRLAVPENWSWGGFSMEPVHGQQNPSRRMPGAQLPLLCPKGREWSFPGQSTNPSTKQRRLSGHFICHSQLGLRKDRTVTGPSADPAVRRWVGGTVRTGHGLTHIPQTFTI